MTRRVRTAAKSSCRSALKTARERAGNDRFADRNLDAQAFPDRFEPCRFLPANGSRAVFPTGFPHPGLSSTHPTKRLPAQGPARRLANVWVWTEKQKIIGTNAARATARRFHLSIGVQYRPCRCSAPLRVDRSGRRCFHADTSIDPPTRTSSIAPTTPDWPSPAGRAARNAARRHVLALHRADGHLAQRGKNMVVQQLPVSAHARRLALHRHVGAQVSLRQIGDGRLPPRLGYLRYWIFSRLDAVDDRRRGLAGLLSGDGSVLAHRDAPRSRWPSTLHHVGRAPSGVKSHTEPRQVPVPVHTGPAMGRQGIYHAFGNFFRWSLGHRSPSLPLLAAPSPTSKRTASV